MKHLFTWLFVSIFLFAPQLINAQTTTTIFSEDFATAGNWAVLTDAKWMNLRPVGNGRQWSGINLGTTSPAAFSYVRNSTPSDSWLITSNQIDLSDTSSNYECGFSFGLGYYIEGVPFNFSVLVTEVFDGVDPYNSTWTDITEEFITTTTNANNDPAKLDNVTLTLPSSGNPGHRPYKTSFNDFRGKKIYLAFRDNSLSAEMDKVSFYLIDNIVVTKTPPPPPGILFSEDFATAGDWIVLNDAKWINLRPEGNCRMWSGINQGQPAPGAFSYARNSSPSDSWLIISSPLDFADTSLSYQCEFSFGHGYYVEDIPFTFSVLVTEAFDGLNPYNSTWTNISDGFITTTTNTNNDPAKLGDVILTLPSAGYPGLRPYKASLDNFKGKEVFLAFRDNSLTGVDMTKASLYLLDNILVTSSILTSTISSSTDNLKYWSSNNVLHLESVGKTNLSIYDISGRSILDQVTIEGNYSVSLSKGVYVIKTDNTTLKHIIR